MPARGPMPAGCLPEAAGRVGRVRVSRGHARIAAGGPGTVGAGAASRAAIMLLEASIILSRCGPGAWVMPAASG